MEFEQMIFGIPYSTIIFIYQLPKNPCVKIWSNKCQMVMINIIVSCVQVYRKI